MILISVANGSAACKWHAIVLRLEHPRRSTSSLRPQISRGFVPSSLATFQIPLPTSLFPTVARSSVVHTRESGHPIIRSRPHRRGDARMMQSRSWDHQGMCLPLGYSLAQAVLAWVRWSCSSRQPSASAMHMHMACALCTGHRIPSIRRLHHRVASTHW